MRSSEMNKFLLSIVAILGVVVALLLANDALCKAMIFSSTGTSQYKMWRLCDGYPKGEKVAIVGSSRAQAGYVPSLIGDNVFNYGLDGSGQYETVLHLHALSKRDDLDLIIVNLDPWGIGGDDLKGDYSLVQNRAAIPTAIDKLPPVDMSVWPGVRFFGKLRATAANWMNSKIGGTKHISDGAILQRISRNEEEWRAINKELVVAPFKIDVEIWKDLDSLLKTAHPKILFVVSPIAKPWYEKFVENAKNVQALADLIAKLNTYPNTIAIDLMTPNIDKYSLDEFFDPTHLNEHGARRFSEELVEHIRGSHTETELR